MAFDLSPTDEQVALSNVLHDIAENELRPAARDVENAGELLIGLWKLLWETGITAPVREEDGGAGMPDAVTMALAAEELAWGDLAIAFAALNSSFVPLLVGLLGTDDQRKRLLTPFIEGPGWGSLALYETDGAALGWMATSLATTGSGFVLNGRKALVVAADRSDVMLCIARGPNGDPVACEVSADVSHVAWEAKLGLEGVPTASVSFNDVALDSAAVLGGGSDAAPAIARCRLAIAAICVGSARAAAEYATAYAQERRAFGKPIGAFQAVAFTIADMATRTDAARLLVWDAASALDQEHYRERDVAMACAHAMEAAVLNGNDAVQVLGGAGYVHDHPVEKWYRDAQTLASVESFDLDADAYMKEATG
ncbi:MAG: acyl-CoA dehydrogenase family protein [Actinomycetota bacterium]